MALERCPQLVIVPTRFDLYRAESARVRAIFLEYTPLVEPLSLDEAYLDVTSSAAPRDAESRRKSGRAFTTPPRLTASAGIAPNKMLAKIASDFNKPERSTHGQTRRGGGVHGTATRAQDRRDRRGHRQAAGR